jgi:hypothetical protein
LDSAKSSGEQAVNANVYFVVCDNWNHGELKNAARPDFQMPQMWLRLRESENT